MTVFIVIAAVMAAAAAAAVALPLLRDRQARVAGAVAAIVVMATAAALYPLWSNFNWHAPADGSAAASPDVAAMVAKLEKHLEGQADDAKGWQMLGRSYMVLERADDAVHAYERAYALERNPDTVLGYGEALSLRAGGEITPEAAALFEEGLRLDSSNPKALLYGGFAALTRGDRAAARDRWEALKDLHPPEQIVALIDARIAELGPLGPRTASAGTNSSPPGTSSSTEPSAQGSVTVKISLAPTLKSQLKSEAPLFVFARMPGQAGPPMAVKRLSSTAIGTQIQLSAADSMMPGRGLAAGQHVLITARVSFSGTPTPATGDLYGEVAAEVGRAGVLDLVIDRVAE